MILFSVDGRCGYSLGDALRKAYTGLDGRDDKLFGGFKSSISIRVEVCVTRRKNAMITMNPIFSGYLMRNGLDRSVSTLLFHRGH